MKSALMVMLGFAFAIAFVLFLEYCPIAPTLVDEFHNLPIFP